MSLKTKNKEHDAKKPPLFLFIARKKKKKKEKEKEKEKENMVQDTAIIEFWLFVWKEEGGKEGIEGKGREGKEVGRERKGEWREGKMEGNGSDGDH